MIYDCVIIGGGPAGLAAAIYLARQKLSFALVTETIGGQVLWSSDIENYLGFHLLDGDTMVKQFRQHLQDYKQDFTLHEGLRVDRVTRRSGGGFIVTGSDKVMETCAILIATGTTHRKLKVPGEDRLYGHGVTYCAHCDAPLYKNKVVCIVGGGNSAMDAAILTEKYAQQVFIITINHALAGDERMIDKLTSSNKTTIITDAKVIAIEGTTVVSNLTFQNQTGEMVSQLCDGVFVEIGLEPVTRWIDFIAKDNRGQIVIDKYNATDVLGIWAAGDVTDVTEKQIAVAVGEGAKAALSIISSIERGVCKIA